MVERFFGQNSMREAPTSIMPCRAPILMTAIHPMKKTALKLGLAIAVLPLSIATAILTGEGFFIIFFPIAFIPIIWHGAIISVTWVWVDQRCFPPE
jgi:hypothetical protein